MSKQWISSLQWESWLDESTNKTQAALVATLTGVVGVACVSAVVKMNEFAVVTAIISLTVGAAFLLIAMIGAWKLLAAYRMHIARRPAPAIGVMPRPVIDIPVSGTAFMDLMGSDRHNGFV